MPFRATANLPVTNSPVTVKFSGLMVLRPGANDTCEVGVHRFTNTHVFQVLLIVNKPNRPPTPIPLLMGQLTAPFLIRLEPDPNPGAGNFLAFELRPEPFDRAAASNEDNDKDHRWAINMRPLHANAQINDGGKPLAILKTGVLYTPNITNSSLAPRLVRSPAPDIQLHRIAADLAASIVPPSRTKILLNWRDRGDEKNIILPRDGDPSNTTYAVCFINNPPDFDSVAHNDFSEYYRILDESGRPIPGPSRFELRFAMGTRTDEIPCNPVTQNP